MHLKFTFLKAVHPTDLFNVEWHAHVHAAFQLEAPGLGGLHLPQLNLFDIPHCDEISALNCVIQDLVCMFDVLLRPFRNEFQFSSFNTFVKEPTAPAFTTARVYVKNYSRCTGK